MTLANLIQVIYDEPQDVSYAEYIKIFSQGLDAYLSLPGTTIDDTTPMFGVSLLFAAVGSAKKPIINILLAKNAEVTPVLFRITPKTSILECLLQSVDKKSQPEKQHFLDMVFNDALAREDLFIADWLFKKGAEIDNKTLFGCTPLMDALRGSKFKVVKFLVEHKANVNAQDTNRRTPLMYAVFTKPVIMATVEFLLEHNAEPNMKDASGEKPIFITSALGLKKITGVLLAAHRDASKYYMGIDSNVRYSSNKNYMGIALDEALSHKKLKIANQLIEAGAPLNCIKKKNLSSNNQGHIITFVKQAFRSLSPTDGFTESLRKSHSNFLERYNQKIADEITIQTPLPLVASEIVHEYLFEDKTLLPSYKQGFKERSVEISKGEQKRERSQTTEYSVNPSLKVRAAIRSRTF